MYHSRYILDALYGHLRFPDYIWEALLCPELQRLREVRLCNINSLCFTGGANVNRYEHSLGTALLALECLDEYPTKIDELTRRRFVLAALLHDIQSTAFGHSVEYVIGRDGFEHDALQAFRLGPPNSKPDGYAYQDASLQPIFFGMPKRLPHLLSEEDLRAIGDMVKGKGDLGALLSGSVDVDNIDNVYRLAYHMGLVRSGETPLELARSMWIKNGNLVVTNSALDKLGEWYELRRTLYRYLLLNPDEFSAKCMLEEALELARLSDRLQFRWLDIDYQLLEKLANSSGDVRDIVSRLMLGDLYGCLGIFSTSKTDSCTLLDDFEARSELERIIQRRLRSEGFGGLRHALVRIHFIRDVNKTQRQIRVVTETGKPVTIGVPSRRILIGIFLKNIRWSAGLIRQELIESRGLMPLIRGILQSAFHDQAIEELVPYGEAEDEPFTRPGRSSTQGFQRDSWYY